MLKLIIAISLMTMMNVVCAQEEMVEESEFAQQEYEAAAYEAEMQSRYPANIPVPEQEMATEVVPEYVPEAEEEYPVEDSY